jgi:hypothetical protein
MNYPGDQVTAPPDQWWRYQSGEHAYAPVQAGFDDEPHEIIPASSGYAASARNGQARNAGPGYAPLAGQRHAAQPGATDVPRPRGEQARHARTGHARDGNAPGNQAPADHAPQGYAPADHAPRGYAPADHAPRGYATADHAPRGYPPAVDVPAGYPSAADAAAGYALSGYSPSGYAPSGYAPPSDAPAGRPGAGGVPQQGNGFLPARRSLPDSTPGTAAVRPGRSRPGPARGYPPRPADPGPRYPQREFSAWNEPAPASLTPDDLPLSAPTWPDTGSAFDPPGPGAGGVALAERARGDLADDELANFSDGDVAAWAASLADELAVAAQAPAPPAGRTGTHQGTAAGRSEPDAGAPPDGGASRTARAAGRTRAAAATARKTARRKVRTRRRMVVAGVCVPAVAAVAVMALQHPSGHAPAKAKVPVSHALSAAAPASAQASHASPSLGTWQHITTRAGDPSPLTLSQLFPAQFTVGSAGYTRTAQDGSTDCARAVFGTKLHAVVRKSGCSQVMRASYLAVAQKLMGTIGVLNLSNFADASKVGKVTGSSQFIAQLTAPSGPTHSLTKGTGLEEAEVKGHYLILTWVEFTTHRAPKTSAEKKQLKAFSADLISQTANVSLTSRMVTGQPQVP